MDGQQNNEEAVFEAATQLPPDQRTAFLKEACGHDDGSRRRVEALLAAHDRGARFMEEPAIGTNLQTVHSSIVLEKKPGDRIGRYKLLQQIGEGGCGVVYMAEQEEPVRRRVALKVIKLGMDTKNVIARFEAERQALALMDHPNIAKIFDAGSTDTGRPFFVMELVRGTRITRYCDENKLTTDERLKLFVQVCQAIQHAHQKGVIHRDIKPSNILVTMRDGLGVPKVIDFGIAKATTNQRLTDKTMFTSFEQFIGTPAYMSPEQAEMSELGIDTRSDIYSLGVLLYELLTGMAPFNAKLLKQAGLDEIRRIIREEEPTRPSTRLGTVTAAELSEIAGCRNIDPSRLSNLIRGELDWIVLKAMEKDRSRRYETVSGFSGDIEHYLADEPVVARPSSNFYRFQKLIRRNRVAVSAAFAVLSALVIGLGIALWEFQQKSVAEREQSRLREFAQSQELSARRKAYAFSMNLVQQALQDDNLARATDLLDQQRPKPGQQDLRGWEWRYLWQFCRSDASAVVCKRSRQVNAVSFSSTASALVVTTEFGRVIVYDLLSTNLVSPDQPSHYIDSRAVFAPSGDWVAYPDNNTLVLWNWRSREEVRRLSWMGDLSGSELQFLSPSRLLVAKSWGTNNVSIWDVNTGVNLTNFTISIYHGGVGMRFAATPDGNMIASVFSDKTVRVMDLAGHNDPWTFPAAEELVTALAFSTDGKILATGGGYTESAIKLWNVRTRQFIGKLEGHRSWISYLKFLPNGTLASGSADQTIRIWDVGALKQIRSLRGHRAEVQTLDVTKDGRTLASGAKDGTVLLWDLTSLDARPPGWSTVDSKNNPRRIRFFKFSPDNKVIATVEDYSVRLYDAENLQPLPEPNLGLTAKAHRLLFSPDSRLLVAKDSAGHFGVWDFERQSQVTNFATLPVQASFLGSSFFRGGKSLLTYAADGSATEWDADSWRKIGSWPLNPLQIPMAPVYSASSPSGLLAYKVAGEGVMHVLHVSEPASVRMVACSNQMVAIAISPNETTIVGASEDGTLTLWDAATLATKATLRGVLLGMHSVAFSPDGSRIMAGSNGREAIKLWDSSSLEDLATLEGKGSLFHAGQFSPDGNMIGAINWNELLHVWRAPSWKEIESSEASARKPPMPISQSDSSY